MTTQSKILCALYGLLALTAGILIPFQNVHYLSDGFINANINFWTDSMANPAGRSVTIDIFVMYFTACILMYIEAKKVGMKHSWAYMVFGYLFAIAVTFPIFLLMRELKVSHLSKA